MGFSANNVCVAFCLLCVVGVLALSTVLLSASRSNQHNLFGTFAKCLGCFLSTGTVSRINCVRSNLPCFRPKSVTTLWCVTHSRQAVVFFRCLRQLRCFVYVVMQSWWWSRFWNHQVPLSDSLPPVRTASVRDDSWEPCTAAVDESPWICLPLVVSHLKDSSAPKLKSTWAPVGVFVFRCETFGPIRQVLPSWWTRLPPVNGPQCLQAKTLLNFEPLVVVQLARLTVVHESNWPKF